MKASRITGWRPSAYIPGKLPCSPALLSGAGFLLGLLLLHLHYSMDPTDDNPSSVLFGHALLPSLGSMLVTVSVLAVAMHWLSLRGTDRFSLAMFAVSGLVSMHFFHATRNIMYTNDWVGHFGYALFLWRHWLSPYGYVGQQSHHPPLYYYVSAISISLAQALHVSRGLTAVRFLSWICYLVFNAFSLLALRRAGLSGTGYRACVALLLLWPAGMHLASKISNESFLYACYAAAFYYAVLWYQEKQPRQLANALCLAGLAFMVRSNAIILFPLIGLLAGVTAYRNRSRFGMHGSRLQYAMVAGWLMLCVVVNSWKPISQEFSGQEIGNHWGASGGAPFPISHFFFLDFINAMARPFNNWSMRQSFWTYFLKTSIFGEYHWAWPSLAIVLNIILFLMIIYTALPWFKAERPEWRGMLPFVAGLAMPITFLLMYAAWVHTITSQDARYIYPAMLCFVACFGRSHALFKAHGKQAFEMAGPLLAWSFVALSIAFFWVQSR